MVGAGAPADNAAIRKSGITSRASVLKACGHVVGALTRAEFHHPDLGEAMPAERDPRGQWSSTSSRLFANREDDAAVARNLPTRHDEVSRGVSTS